MFVGRNFSAVFQPGRGLHGSTSGFAGSSRASTLSEFQVLRDWFISLVNSRIARKIQTVKSFPRWIPTSTHPGIEGNLYQPTNSGDIAVWGLCKAVCECETTCWATVFRRWFDIHATYSQFVRPRSGSFWALWELRGEIFLTLLGHLAAVFSFSFSA